MMSEISDFRSDSVTKPTEKMRRAMAEAVVGDDVLGDDPTVQKLEALAAEIMGKEAALFVPSRTMGNLIAVKVWTQELEEVIVEARSHIFNMESTHMTFISRVTPRPLHSNRGAMDPDEVEQNIRKPSVQTPRTSLICLENTHDSWSGAVVPIANLRAMRQIADKSELKLHLDGARIFNASTASGIPVEDYAALVDSVMFCLDKGLSAPVGSMLAGSRNFIEYARKVRNTLGGGMRQVGVLAAPGIIALTEMPSRLHLDHERAKKMASAIAKLPGVELNPENVLTNIVVFGFSHPEISIGDLLVELQERRILAMAAPDGTGIRLVTHKDIGDEDIERAVAVFQEILS
jgi:threonine aldolase